MRFFARLSPAARAKNAVQPVLPPRFANAGADLHEIDAEEAAMPMSPAPSVEPRQQQPMPREALNPTQRETMPAPNTHVDAIEAPSSPLPLPHRTWKQSFPPDRAAKPSSDAPMRPLAASLLHLVQMHGPADITNPSGQTAPLSPRVEIAPSRDDGPALPTRRRPLSPIGLAQRLYPAKSDSTVVHVTIDRIEVRAPGAPATPSTQTKPRVTPIMSLSDYLRRAKP